jgi:nitroimidazol reductase NimA-like FMN-containing flavoprotein (pyridoxamine 5'-phosphate oxidase superfamily)
MSHRMTALERETFLADLHVAVLGICGPDRGPLLMPIWYSYHPGAKIKFVTNKDSKKIKLLAPGVRITICVQNEDPPYQYVSVEGTITSIDVADHDLDFRPIAHRYLGVERGDRYVENTVGDEELLIQMSPEKWSTADYSKISNAA